MDRRYRVLDKKKVEEMLEADIPPRKPRGPEVRYYRKVLQIRAEDTPNIQYALAQIAKGIRPDNTIIVPGIITWEEYQRRRKTWDKRRQTIGLDAEFYEGQEVLLCPPVWMIRASQLATLLRNQGIPRQAKAVGCDPGEGDANTSMCAVDELGVMDIWAQKTPNTAKIKNQLIAFGRQHHVKPMRWWMDAGGGGKQIAHEMRENGFNVNTVAFGQAATAPAEVRTLDPKLRRDDREGRYAYKNRRAEMFGIFRTLLDPGNEDLPVEIGCKGYAIPDWTDTFVELRRQLSLIPLLYDGQGRMYLPSKSRKDKNSTEITLTEMVGRSPDEADSAVLATFGMTRPDRRPVIGVW